MMTTEATQRTTANRDICNEVGMALAFMFLRSTGVHRDLLDRSWASEGPTYAAGLGHTCREVAQAFLSHGETAEHLTTDQRMCFQVGEALASLDVDAAVDIAARARETAERTSDRWSGISDGLADIVDGYRLRLAQYLDTLGSELSFRPEPDSERSELFVLLATALFEPKADVLRELGGYLNAFDERQVNLVEERTSDGVLSEAHRERLRHLMAKYHSVAA